VRFGTGPQIASARLIPRRCSSIEVICTDATQFVTPNGPNILFFYDPFSLEIMEIVLGNIARSYLDNPRSVFLIFYASSSKIPKISEFLPTKTNGRASWLVSTTIGLRSINIFELPYIEPQPVLSALKNGRQPR
jgi:hypothetical protein